MTHGSAPPAEPVQTEGRGARRPGLWPVLAVLGVMAAVVAFLLTNASAQTLTPRPGAAPPVNTLPEGLRHDLGAELTEILERSTPTEHAHHGHSFGEKAGKVVCAVDPFGVEPATATALKDVKVVYANHLCAITGTGDPWYKSVRAGGPLAVTRTAPVRVRVPAAGAGYPGHVREAIPERYLELALSGAVDDDVIAEARGRFDELALG